MHAQAFVPTSQEFRIRFLGYVFELLQLILALVKGGDLRKNLVKKMSALNDLLISQHMFCKIAKEYVGYSNACNILSIFYLLKS